MKRLIGALLLTASLAALPLAPAGAAPADQVKGSACGDITADANYTDAFTGVRTVFATVDTAKPSCDRATYTLTVYSTGSNPLILGQDSATGDGVTSHFELDAAPIGGPDVVCVALKSSIGGKTVDLAPDNADGQCSIGTQLIVNGGTGASGMR